MRLLLDTHAFLWWCDDDPRLGSAERAAIRDGANEVFLSAASVWEMAIKQGLDRLLVAQARLEGPTLVTQDPLIRAHPGVAFLPA